MKISCLVIIPSKRPLVGLTTHKCLRCICRNRDKTLGRKSYFWHFSGFSIMYGLKSIKSLRWSWQICLTSGVIAISRDKKSLVKSDQGKTAAFTDSGNNS